MRAGEHAGVPLRRVRAVELARGRLAGQGQPGRGRGPADAAVVAGRRRGRPLGGRDHGRRAGAEPQVGDRDDYQGDDEQGPVIATGPASFCMMKRDAGPYIPRGTGVPLRSGRPVALVVTTFSTPSSGACGRRASAPSSPPSTGHTGRLHPPARRSTARPGTPMRLPLPA